MRGRSKVAALVLLLLLFAGCVTTPSAATSPLASRYGWLSDLAGSCWHENNFGADVCYWEAGPGNLYWFSRNRGELLGCGKYIIEEPPPARGSIHAWDSDSVESVMRFTLTADTLVTDEDAEHPRGSTQRISRDRFSIQDRPGAPALNLTRKSPLSQTDSAILQCLDWEVQKR